MNNSMSRKRKSTSKAKLNSTEDTTYEAERILDHVTFEYAFQEYFANNNKRYENIFTTYSFDNPRMEHDKYFYLIKWKQWTKEWNTWECEGNCTSMSHLSDYKRYNGLPIKRIRMKTVPCSEIPGKLKVVYEKEEEEEASDSTPKSYSFYPTYIKYNQSYGMIRCDDAQRLKLVKDTEEVMISLVKKEHATLVLLERDMQYVSKCNVSKRQARKFDMWQQEVQTKDRSYLSSVINHPNIVKMLDYYFKCNSPKGDRNPVYCYIYEHFENDLKKKITAGAMTVEESKRMCVDMLSNLSLLHDYGVHHNISKNHIYVDGNVYKLSHFENFRFFTDFERNDENKLYYSNVYRPMESYEPLDIAETTFDIYALGIVLLESLTNGCIEVPIENDTENLKRTIKDKLETLSDPSRLMVSMMLNCREYIHEKKVPEYRFSAKSLLRHPWLNDKQFKFIKCIFLASYYSKPIDEVLFYKDNDKVKTVVDRLTCLYSNLKDVNYQMFFIENMGTSKSPINYIGDAEIFVDVLEEFNDLRLVIVPILQANYMEPVVHKSISFVYFLQEFGTVPIVIESAAMSDKDVCKTVIEQAFPSKDRGLPFIIRRLIPDHGRLTNEYTMCPRSLIDESLQHIFPKTMEGDEYDIAARDLPYCITIKKYDDLENQPETAENDAPYHVCEFAIRYGEMSEGRKCRLDFDPIANRIKEN